MSRRKNKHRIVKPLPPPKERPKRDWDLIFKAIRTIAVVMPVILHLIDHFNRYADRIPL